MSAPFSAPAPRRGASRGGFGRRQTRVARRPPKLTEALPFQDPIDEICDQPPPVLLRSTHYVAVGLLLALLAVAAVTRVDVVVIAPGRVATATPPIVLQPMERAIIRTMRVHPGDVVVKDQTLATLDPTFAAADASVLETQMRAAGAEIRRLEAEEDGRAFGGGPGGPGGAEVAGDSDEALQARLFQQRQAEYATRLRAFDEDLRRLRASLATADDDRASLGRELEVARAVERMRAELLRLRSGSELNLLEAKGVRLRAEHDQQEAADHLVEVLHGLQSRTAERQAFVDGWRRDLVENLVKARAEMAQLTASRAKAARLRDLVVLKAPVDGVVLDVAPRTEGSVLREAEPLLTLVPRDAVLIADVTIASGEVGDAAPGASVTVKVDAFPYQRFGTVAGRLLSVSEESFSGEAGDPSSSARQGAVHRGRVALLSTEVESGSRVGRLFPGMTLTAEIASGSRSVLSFFLAPLARVFRESFREP